jgi:transaldolase
VRQGLEAGAIHCTTNPTYAARMLRETESRDFALRVVDAVLSECADDNKAAALIQRRLIAEMAQGFMPHFEATKGKEGLVSIQMDSRFEKMLRLSWQKPWLILLLFPML